MKKKSNVDDLSEEELAELLDSSEDDFSVEKESIEINENNLEDEKSTVEEPKAKRKKKKAIEKELIKEEILIPEPPIENAPTILEEVNVLSIKERKRQERMKKREAKLLEKAKNRMVRKHRKAIKNNPEKLIRYETNPEFGLPNEVVDKRVLDCLVNDTKNKTSKSLARIFFSNIVTFFNILTFAIAGVLISVKAFTDLVFIIIVSLNIGIGIFQEIRAKKTIDRLSLISAPTAVVKRSGVVHEISVKEVVLDDIILLENGKQICADSIIVTGQVEVNESLLTGESDAIIKKPGDVLYSGSFVVSGKCSARVDKVGKDNYIEQLTSQAKQYKKPKSDLFKSLKLIIYVMAIIIIPIGVFLFYIMNIKSGLDYVYSIRKTAGAMIGMIPSGLMLMTSIALAVGVIRLSQHNVLVQELYCIEMLARVNCICLDKTGTITDGTMSVKNVVDYNTIHGLATKNIISAMLNALQDSNLTSVALQEKFGLGKRIRHIAAIPFSSQRKYQAVTFDKFGTFILGAPEFVLKDSFKLIKADVNKYATLGYRVLCLAHKEGTIKDNQLPDSPVEVVSMILIEDNIRPDAINTIRYFKESGVSVRVISGDNPLTVSKISQRAGIENAEDYISLDGLSDQDVQKAALKYTVFGRVSPSQKKLLIQTLKESGLTVAMTGDGVNDILALKEADCSIAVASGSEAARNVSHLVLLDSNFDSMPKVVSEGRRVINNVTSVASLFLTKTIFSLFLAIQALQTGSYPISTNQLFLIDTLAIGLPSLFLVMEPNNNLVDGKFLPNVIKKALPGAIVILIISAIVFGLSSSLNLDQTSVSTIIVIAATHTCMMVLFKTCKPFNTLRKFLCGICYSLFLFAVFIMPQFLEFRPLASFAEYYSESLTTRVVSAYPDVEISKDGYYIIDGIVTSFQKSPNSKTENVTCVQETNSITGAVKYFYQIGGTQVDTEVIIPEITYSDSGRIYLGGFKVDNFRFDDVVSYTLDDGITRSSNSIVIREDGVVCNYNDENGKSDPLLITLPKNKTYEYYDHYINYGTTKDTQVEYKIMPTVEVRSNELLINGKNSEQKTVDGLTTTYTYFLENQLSSLDSIECKIVLNEYTNQYELYINNQKVVMRSSEDDTITPYTVEIPTLSSNGNKYSTDNIFDSSQSGALYVGAIDTEFNIFEVYGDIDTSNSRQTSYTLYDASHNPITYIRSAKENYCLYMDKKINNFIFSSASTGFAGYFSSEKELNVNAGEDMIQVTPDTSNYRLYIGGTDAKYFPSKTNTTTDSRLGVSIANSTICPEIETTTSGKYIISGYYTEFVAARGELNPRIDDNYNLILGGITTNYKVSTSEVIIERGGIVSELSVSGKVFLLMLCLLSAPLMKVLQGLVPWIIKQGKYIQKLLSKF